MLTLKAPAKINLTLEVLRQRTDGFHEIRSVLQTIDLYDTLHIQAGKGVSLQCDMLGWSAEKSLMSEVVSLLREMAGDAKGAAIKIEKHIPLLAGLGGDSSGAAALLHGLNDFWSLHLSPEKLLELAERLGSDVAFFLHGGTALAAGRGEIIKPLPAPPKMWLVLVVPDIPVALGKTARMYAALKPSHFTDGAITQRLVDTLKNGQTLHPSMLFNTFENIAFNVFQGLNVYKEHLIKLGAPDVHLAGSGPALFAVFQDKALAADLYARCKNQGMTVYLAETL